jgi:hypothetical protein
MMGLPRHDNLLVYQDLEEPTHGLNLFYGQPEKWSQLLVNADFANQTPPYTREETFAKLLLYMDAWRFEKHAMNRFFFAAWVMCITNVDSFENMPNVLVTAPSQSGKSTFTKGALRGEDPAHIGILDHIRGADDFTAAGIQQGAESSPILQAADEWENPDDANKNDAKSRAVAGLLQSVRNASGRKGMRRVRGGRYGQQTVVELRYPIIGSGIHPLREEADRNRWFTIELVKEEGRRKPEAHLLDVFGKQGIAYLKKSILLHSLQSAYKDYLSEIEILEELDASESITDSRGAKALAPLLVIMKAVGVDYMGWAQKFMAWRTQVLRSGNTSAERTMLLAVLETNAITLPGEYTRRSLILRIGINVKLLLRPEFRAVARCRLEALRWLKPRGG